MHIHQGHWSLSSAAWWTLLCNNQLIYILPSSAICVDYREKAMCVCVCARVSWRSLLYRFDTPCYLIYTLTPYMHTDSEEDFMHAHIGAHIFRRRLCLTPVSPLSPVPSPSPNPFPLVGSSWHLSWVVNSCGSPDCAVLKTWGPPRSLLISAGQSLKAARCDGADWQLGSHARGYQHSVSRERVPSQALA